MSNTSTTTSKTSYTRNLIMKRKLALEAANKNYLAAVNRSALEIGKVCLEFGMGDIDIAVLKANLPGFIKGLPKSQEAEPVTKAKA